jgi:hypothetical protein
MCIMGVIPAYDKVLAIQYSAPVAYDCIIFILTVYRICVSCAYGLAILKLFTLQFLDF